MNEQCLPGLLAIFYKNSMLAAPRESSGQNLGVGQFGRVAFWPEFSLGEIRSSTAFLSELSLGEIRSGTTFLSEFSLRAIRSICSFHPSCRLHPNASKGQFGRSPCTQ